MMIKDLEIWRLSRKFKDYSPTKVTRQSIGNWLNQYDKKDHEILIKLLKKIIYYSQEDIKRFLIAKNSKLLNKLANVDIQNKNTIYVTIDETASSSHVILNLLRDLCQLEKRGCKLVDSNDILHLNRVVNDLGSGAVVYVDDFAGTGNQLCKSRDHIVNNIPIISTKFSEFFLAPCICSEAAAQLAVKGIEPFTNHTHEVSERILHPENTDTFMSNAEKNRLLELSREVDKKSPLGYNSLATMVVMYRNTPNTVPALIRGDSGQKNKKGVLPRTTDLPIINPQ